MAFLLAYTTREHVYASHCCNCRKFDLSSDSKNCRCFGDAPSNYSGTSVNRGQKGSLNNRNVVLNTSAPVHQATCSFLVEGAN